MTGPGLVLLASFPKSGNTWLRVIFDAMLGGGQPDISRIGSANAAQRNLLDAWLDCETSDLSAVQVARMRPWAYQRAAREAKAPLILKTHDALLPFVAGTPAPFAPEGIRAVLYMARDPRDVVVSWSHHMGCSIDETIERMGDETWSVSSSDQRLRYQVDQLYSSWSRHVESWVNATDFPVHLIRYEDLSADPHSTLSRAFAFAGIDADEKMLSDVIEGARFERLQAQEKARGFAERKPESTAAFFRSGLSGRWKNQLTPAQATRIERDHEAVMRRLGYLT